MLIEHKVEMEMLKELQEVIETKLDALAEMTNVYEAERVRLCKRIEHVNAQIANHSICKSSKDKPF